MPIIYFDFLFEMTSNRIARQKSVLAIIAAYSQRSFSRSGICPPESLQSDQRRDKKHRYSVNRARQYHHRYKKINGEGIGNFQQ